MKSYVCGEGKASVKVRKIKNIRSPQLRIYNEEEDKYGGPGNKKSECQFNFMKYR